MRQRVGPVEVIRAVGGDEQRRPEGQRHIHRHEPPRGGDELAERRVPRLRRQVGRHHAHAEPEQPAGFRRGEMDPGEEQVPIEEGPGDTGAEAHDHRGGRGQADPPGAAARRQSGRSRRRCLVSGGNDPVGEAFAWRKGGERGEAVQDHAVQLGHRPAFLALGEVLAHLVGQRRRMKRVEVFSSQVVDRPALHSGFSYGRLSKPVSLFEVRERDAELVPRAVDVGLHRT